MRFASVNVTQNKQIIRCELPSSLEQITMVKISNKPKALHEYLHDIMPQSSDATKGRRNYKTGTMVVREINMSEGLSRVWRGSR